MPKFDITKHQWSDSSAECSPDKQLYGDLHLYCAQVGEITLNEDDAIAIAKHFNLLNCSCKKRHYD